MNEIDLLIKKQADRDNSKKISPLLQEILHHAKHAERLTSKMNYTKNQYSDVEKYLLNYSNSPFLIAGPSGAGKSRY